MGLIPTRSLIQLLLLLQVDFFTNICYIYIYLLFNVSHYLYDLKKNVFIGSRSGLYNINILPLVLYVMLLVHCTKNWLC